MAYRKYCAGVVASCTATVACDSRALASVQVPVQRAPSTVCQTPSEPTGIGFCAVGVAEASSVYWQSVGLVPQSQTAFGPAPQVCSLTSCMASTVAPGVGER